MQDIFITKIQINEVRNIKDFEINLSETERKHLIITGKNGSGKTSLLEDLSYRLNPSKVYLSNSSKVVFSPKKENLEGNLVEIFDNAVEHPLMRFFVTGEFIIKYFGAKRGTEFVETRGIEKIEFKKNYKIDETIGNEFTQHIVNLQFDKLYAKNENDLETANQIDNWFAEFEKELAKLFDEPKFKLTFDIKNYSYQIIENGNLPYTFNQLPDGYSAILDIVTELIMRMEKHKTKSYDVQGIILIDEIETHLHVDLQKKILPFLTSFFPRIQFIVTTHSPFVLNSIENAVVCDLEKRIVTEDLSGYSYDTIVESYFDSDNYSTEFVEKLAEYEDLMERERKDLTDEERDRLNELEIYLDSIPKYWAKEFAVKYQQIKLKSIDKVKLRNTIIKQDNIASHINGKFKILIIADPAEGDLHLDGAAGEGRELKIFFEELNNSQKELTIKVDSCIGSRECDIVDVLSKIFIEEYDLIHFSGHGHYDKDDETNSGWVFGSRKIKVKEGNEEKEIEKLQVISPREIFRLIKVPRLVFANSSFNAQVEDGKISIKSKISTQELNQKQAAIAELFLARGIENYIGSGWQVNDSTAVNFAKTFYTQALTISPKKEMNTLSIAFKKAQKEIKKEVGNSTWDEYQFYGDSNSRLFGINKKQLH